MRKKEMTLTIPRLDHEFYKEFQAEFRDSGVFPKIAQFLELIIHNWQDNKRMIAEKNNMLDKIAKVNATLINEIEKLK